MKYVKLLLFEGQEEVVDHIMMVTEGMISMVTVSMTTVTIVNLLQALV